MFEWNEFDNGEWDPDEDKPAKDEPVIISRQVAWFCANCDEQNFTDMPFERAACSECGKEYSAFLIGSQEGTYEQTLDSNGNFDADAYIPDLPDEFVTPDDGSDYPDDGLGPHWEG